MGVAHSSPQSPELLCGERAVEDIVDSTQSEIAQNAKQNRISELRAKKTVRDLNDAFHRYRNGLPDEWVPTNTRNPAFPGEAQLGARLNRLYENQPRAFHELDPEIQRRYLSARAKQEAKKTAAAAVSVVSHQPIKPPSGHSASERVQAFFDRHQGKIPASRGRLPEEDAMYQLIHAYLYDETFYNNLKAQALRDYVDDRRLYDALGEEGYAARRVANFFSEGGRNRLPKQGKEDGKAGDAIRSLIKRHRNRPEFLLALWKESEGAFFAVVDRCRLEAFTREQFDPTLVDLVRSKKQGTRLSNPISDGEYRVLRMLLESENETARQFGEKWLYELVQGHALFSLQKMAGRGNGYLVDRGIVLDDVYLKVRNGILQGKVQNADRLRHWILQSTEWKFMDAVRGETGTNDLLRRAGTVSLDQTEAPSSSKAPSNAFSLSSLVQLSEADHSNGFGSDHQFAMNQPIEEILGELDNSSGSVFNAVKTLKPQDREIFEIFFVRGGNNEDVGRLNGGNGNRSTGFRRVQRFLEKIKAKIQTDPRSESAQPEATKAAGTENPILAKAEQRGRESSAVATEAERLTEKLKKSDPSFAKVQPAEVQSFLDQLAKEEREQDRKLFLLRYLEGKTSDQIAQETGKDPAQVRQDLVRLRRLLLERVGAE